DCWVGAGVVSGGATSRAPVLSTETVVCATSEVTTMGSGAAMLASTLSAGAASGAVGAPSSDSPAPSASAGAAVVDASAASFPPFGVIWDGCAGVAADSGGFGRRSIRYPSDRRIEAKSSPEVPVSDIIDPVTTKPEPSTAPAGLAPGAPGRQASSGR